MLCLICFLNFSFVTELDDRKAAKLAQLEKDLNLRQEQILDAARQRIDALNEEANRLKMVNSFDEIFFIWNILFSSRVFSKKLKHKPIRKSKKLLIKLLR